VAVEDKDFEKAIQAIYDAFVNWCCMGGNPPNMQS
jgi:hypothetical protein